MASLAHSFQFRIYFKNIYPSAHKKKILRLYIFGRLERTAVGEED